MVFLDSVERYGGEVKRCALGEGVDKVLRGVRGHFGFPRAHDACLGVSWLGDDSSTPQIF